MNYIQTEIDGVWLIEPNVYSDERGYFMEAFKKEEFEAKIGPVDFVQDNESKSSFGVLRGLHYQKGEYSQAKLVRVLKGKVLDVAVDLRRSSPTFGKHVSALRSHHRWQPARRAGWCLASPGQCRAQPRCAVRRLWW